jgi:diacylglycerol kinase (ATP)
VLNEEISVALCAVAMDNKRFKIGDRLKSFRFAFNGIRVLFITEHNARIHLAAALSVIIAGAVLKISVPEWVAVIIAAGMVFASEAINTSIEKLSDFVSPEKQKSIKEVKDLAAAGVLISSITALLIGMLVFLPKIWMLFKTA